MAQRLHETIIDLGPRTLAAHIFQGPEQGLRFRIAIRPDQGQRLQGLPKWYKKLFSGFYLGCHSKNIFKNFSEHQQKVC